MEQKTEHNAPHAPPNPFKAGEKVPLTKGERVFDEVTYRGVDWLANSVVGVAATYLTARTLWGQKHFTEPVTGFFMKNLKPLYKTEEALQTAAKWSTSLTSIAVGGFTIIPPIMALEAYKKPIVKAIDRKIYGDHEVESNPDLNAAYKAIDEEPAKNFSIGMITRFVSLAPILYVVGKYPQQLNYYMYEPIAKASKWVCKQVGYKNDFLMNRMLPDEFGKSVSDWDFIHQKIGFDFSLTLAYSYIHEFTYKWCSSLFETKKGESEKVIPPKHASAAPQPFRVKEQQGESITMVPSEKPKSLGYVRDKPDNKTVQREHIAALKEQPSQVVGGVA